MDAGLPEHGRREPAGFAVGPSLDEGWVPRNKHSTSNMKPRRAPRDVPDSLPRRDEGTDVTPDDVRRTDHPLQETPDSVPAREEGKD